MPGRLGCLVAAMFPVLCGGSVAEALAMESRTYDAPPIPEGQERSEKALGGGKMRWWPERPDQAEVVTASFLGGSGSEYLVDGGFLPDGTLVLAGNAIGGDFELSVPVAVMGPDGVAPPPHAPEPRLQKGSWEKIDRKKTYVPGPPVVDRLGRPRYEPLNWTDAAATGFIALVDVRNGTVRQAARLPWGSGAITACEVDPESGAIYVAGRALAGAAELARDSVTATSEAQLSKGAFGCEQTFVAKVLPDLSGVDWVRVVTGNAYAPTLQFNQEGQLVAALADLRTFDADGRLVSTITVDRGLGPRSSVSPITGEIAYGSERHSSTGREPWRCPIFRFAIQMAV